MEHIIEQDELVPKLYRNTMTGEWDEVIKIYEKYTMAAILTKINRSGDTPLHVAVSIAPDDIVEKLVDVINDFIVAGLQIMTNNEGNTPLHVAASTGRVRMCVLLALAGADEDLGLVRNNRGESSLFLAAFHGRKTIFFCLQQICVLHRKIVKNNPAYRRNDGETILHCVIRWEYFGEHF